MYINHLVRQCTCINILKIRRYSRLQYEEYKKQIAIFESGTVQLEKCKNTGIANIILDNPKAMNAISGSMAADLENILNELSGWKNGKFVILQGSNKQFCTGGDLQNFMSKIDTPERGAMMCEYMQSIMMNFQRLPFISIALLQGKILGGGAELAVACDYRLMDDSAKIGFVQAKMGLTTGFGGGQNLVRLLGYRKALRILVAHRLMNADEALRNGLVDAILTGEGTVMEWLEKENFLGTHHSLIQGLKSMTLKASESQTDDALIHERETFEKFWRNELHKQALEQNVKHR